MSDNNDGAASNGPVLGDPNATGRPARAAGPCT